MEQTIDQTQATDDAWEVADNAKPRDFEYFGQVKADVWFGYFPGNKAKPIPFDPQQHPADKRAVMIDIQIIPVPEQNVTFDIRQNYTDFSLDWTKITLPSIKALGVDGLRALNGHYVRVAQVDGKREKKDENGHKTGEFYKTFKFLELYPDAAACSAAYAGAAPSHTEQTPDEPAGDKEKETALKFAKVVVENTARGETDLNAVRTKVATALAGMPMINKHFTVDSPEIMNLIMEVMPK
ncbi:MAG TPA: hypothetical protein DCP32_08960 [Anaerolineaceae bacterium]|nr:hypothetical protein [Anaerolineaceae bacterium]